MTEILEKIESKQKLKSEDVLKGIYEKMFPGIAKYIRDNSGSFEDAKDTFHDALIIYIEQKSERIIRTSNEAYIFGIVKHLWLKKLNEKNKNLTIEIQDKNLVDLEIDEFTIDEKKLTSYLQQVGQKCLDILRACYFQDLNMSELANKMKYKNAHTLSVQKYKCLFKMRHILNSKSLNYDDFKK